MGSINLSGVVGLFAALALIGGALGGCASLRGAPTTIGAAPDYVKDAAEPNLIAANAAQDSQRRNMTKRQWRDYVIDQEIARVDANYNAFLASLRQEAVGSNLVLGLGTLALSTAGTVADVDDANELAAWTAGLVGARETINKDLFFQRTMPALASAMEANRKKVLVTIRASQVQPPEVYTLGAALRDIRTYEMAGTVDMAIAELTSLAQEESADATEQLSPMYTATLREEAVHVRVKALTDHVRALEVTALGGSVPGEKAAAETRLRAIAKLLGIAEHASLAVNQLDNRIRIEIDKRATDAASVDALSILLKPETEKDF